MVRGRTGEGAGTMRRLQRAAGAGARTSGSSHQPKPIAARRAAASRRGRAMAMLPLPGGPGPRRRCWGHGSTPALSGTPWRRGRACCQGPCPWQAPRPSAAGDRTPATSSHGALSTAPRPSSSRCCRRGAALPPPARPRRAYTAACLPPLLQGIDLNAAGRNKRVHRTAPKSENPYVKLLVKVRGRRAGPGPREARVPPQAALHTRSHGAQLSGAAAAAAGGSTAARRQRPRRWRRGMERAVCSTAERRVQQRHAAAARLMEQGGLAAADPVELGEPAAQPAGCGLCCHDQRAARLAAWSGGM